ncbi:MAG: leucine-rich repeat domain-containing protein [Lachnospiraceae bacterium]|nr:leucine-rich repeat domain-containing protein [Lachnospiraceae bacterium]
MKRFLIAAASALLPVLLFFVCGCGDSNKLMGNVFGGDGADAVFCIISGTEVSAADDDVLSLINIDGQTFADCSGLEFSLPEGETALSLTGTNGVIKANEVEQDTAALLTAASGGKTFTIRVVVFANVEARSFISEGNLVIPYGVSSIGTTYAGSDIRYARIPGTMSEIEEKAFSGCKKLERVDMSTSVRSIGPHAFKECESLTEIVIPQKIKVIENSAFRQCLSLKKIELPDSVEKIDLFAFYDCSSLEEIIFPDTVKTIEDNSFGLCESLRELRIPEGVTAIGDWAFSDCSSLEKLELPSTLRQIGARAFMNCKGLSSLTIPTRVTKLGTDVFNGCSGIRYLSIPAAIKIEKGFFSGVTHLEEVHLTGEGSGADYTTTNYIYTPWYLSRNHSIKAVVEEGVSSIGDYTFVKCTGLTEVSLPKSLQHIMHGAFRKCTSLVRLDLPEGLLQIDDYAFSLCRGLTTVNFPQSLRLIGVHAFAYDDALEEAIIPDAVMYVGPQAFYACNSLTKVRLGESVASQLKVIGAEAFSGFMFECRHVEIHSEKLTAVGRAAFGFCTRPFGFDYFAALADGAEIAVSAAARPLLSESYNYYAKDCVLKQLGMESQAEAN